MPVLCQKHAAEVAHHHEATGPCSPANRWEGGRGDVIECEVTATPAAVANFVEYLLAQPARSRPRRSPQR